LVALFGCACWFFGGFFGGMAGTEHGGALTVRIKIFPKEGQIVERN
jgi:hypothetical protein